MKFLVLNEDKIKTYNIKYNHIVISIKSPGASKAEILYLNNCLDILYLEFHDFDNLSLNYPGHIKVFSKQDAKKILNFVKKYKEKIDLIVCQCEAGISRSAGVIGALSKIFNGDDTRIFKEYLPNMLVYRTILKEYYK